MTFSHRQARRLVRDPERGETLVELLATLILMGIGILAVLTGILTLVTASDGYQRRTRATVTATEVAEAMKAPVGDMKYIRCARASGSPTYPAFVPAQLPAGWQARITNIEYVQTRPATTGIELVAGTSQMRWRPTNAACTTTGSGQEAGLQRITVQVNTPSGSGRPAKSTVVLVKRNQTCEDFVTAYDNFDGGPC